MPDQDQKTEQPTPRRLEKARKEGQFPASREFVSSLQFGIWVTIIIAGSTRALEVSGALLRRMIASSFEVPADVAAVVALWRAAASAIGPPLVASGAAVCCVALLAQLVSTRFGITTARLAPDLSRLNPLNRLRRLPQQNFAQFWHAVALLGGFTLLAVVIAERYLARFTHLSALPLGPGVIEVGRSVGELLKVALVGFLVIGAWDLWRERRRWLAEVRMSKQEIREEAKEVEGNPMIKARLRRLMRELVRRRMMSNLDKATAVVVNPTHYAVALRYVPSEMRAPKVVAKGKNFLAQRIRERAIRRQIPIVENPPLAQALYKSVQVGQEIPAHLYKVVAEVLAYIYRLMHGRLPGA